MQKIILLLLCFLVTPNLSHAEAKKDPNKKTVCLNMIVKNESDVIERCLKSVKNLVDYWVIVDTGSTDGTQKIIKKVMKGIPGELHERPWVGFAHNRNEALAFAKNKADYVFMMDADEILEYGKDFALPPLDKDFYYMTVRQLDAVDVLRTALVKARLDWKWEGALHEIIVCPAARTHEPLHGIINICNEKGRIGGRSKVSTREKYLKDAKVLEEALKEEPENSRYVMYLAQSYLAADEFELARKNFEKRTKMESIDVQETFRAIYTLGTAQEKLNLVNEAMQSYFKAYEYRPTRAEPLFRAAVLYRKSGNCLLGYLLVKHALSLPYPQGDVCVEYQTYDHAMLIELANCALLMGKFDEGLQYCTQLLNNPRLPAEYKPPIVANYELAQRNLQKPEDTYECVDVLHE